MITRAVIAVAGSGTRFLPATKAMPKEMITLIDRPVIQYVVEELVASGITEIMFVTSRGKEALVNHFDEAPELEAQLQAAGKFNFLEKVRETSSMARYHFTRQTGPYGNGTPLLCVDSFIRNDPFVFVFGDDLVRSDVPFTKRLIDRYIITGKPVIGVDEVPFEEVHRYGVVDMDMTTGVIRRVVEKPKREDAPSNLVQFGRMVLTREIVDTLKQVPTGKGGELWLTDAIARYIENGGEFLAERIPDGRWYTTGDPLSMLEATVEYALRHPEMGALFSGYLKKYRE